MFSVGNVLCPVANVLCEGAAVVKRLRLFACRARSPGLDAEFRQ